MPDPLQACNRAATQEAGPDRTLPSGRCVHQCERAPICITVRSELAQARTFQSRLLRCWPRSENTPAGGAWELGFLRLFHRENFGSGLIRCSCRDDDVVGCKSPPCQGGATGGFSAAESLPHPLLRKADRYPSFPLLDTDGSGLVRAAP